MSSSNNILLTGYWPPTNEMLRQFSVESNDSSLWTGKNWRNRGFDIYSYFPEFSGSVDNDPVGQGDFKVDYQSTSSDWARVTEKLRPCAIITFSRGWTKIGFYRELDWLGKT